VWDAGGFNNPCQAWRASKKIVPAEIGPIWWICEEGLIVQADWTNLLEKLFFDDF
jgi:hypothetical protein